MTDQTIDFSSAARIIRTDRCLPAWVAVRDGWLPDLSPRSLDVLVEAGYHVGEVRAKPTARSRHAVPVTAIARCAATAAAPWHTHVQYWGLALGRRALRVPADSVAWRVYAHHTVKRTVDGVLLPGVVPDARWDQDLGDARSRPWYVEYSAGSYSRARLLDKIRAYGPNPQVWITASQAHAEVVEELLETTYPALAHTRVLVIRWTGEAA